ncbi:hypothetical protein HMPREF9413_3535 [Paenibacillus sp. HGF7]|nr:hypothetical protein HMPREF9413_3535 [Paenibacillus sp. HGF7]
MLQTLCFYAIKAVDPAFQTVAGALYFLNVVHAFYTKFPSDLKR